MFNHNAFRGGRMHFDAVTLAWATHSKSHCLVNHTHWPKQNRPKSCRIDKLSGSKINFSVMFLLQSFFWWESIILEASICVLWVWEQIEVTLNWTAVHFRPCAHLHFVCSLFCVYGKKRALTPLTYGVYLQLVTHDVYLWLTLKSRHLMDINSCTAVCCV